MKTDLASEIARFAEQIVRGARANVAQGVELTPFAFVLSSGNIDVVKLAMHPEPLRQACFGVLRAYARDAMAVFIVTEAWAVTRQFDGPSPCDMPRPCECADRRSAVTFYLEVPGRAWGAIVDIVEVDGTRTIGEPVWADGYTMQSLRGILGPVYPATQDAPFSVN